MLPSVVTRSGRSAIVGAFVFFASALLFTGSAAATFPGANGKIVGHGPGFGVSDVYTVKSDGSGRTNLTVSSFYEVEPAWSPDGRRIAYARSSATVLPTAIYVMNADGTEPEQITSSSARAPAWSPDGTEIVFVQGSNSIEITDADEMAEPVALATGNAPSWSPDGSRIAYSKGGDIWVIEPDGENETQLTEGEALDENPDWSPDGSKILFSRAVDGWEVYAMDADGSDEAQVGSAALVSYRAGFSPDGTKLQLETGYIVGADGSGSTPLGPDFYPADWQPRVSGQLPPTASFTSPSAVLTDQAIQFTSTSTGGSGAISAQSWDFDYDGQFNDAAGSSASTSFGTPGTYTVRLSVANSLGARDAIAASVLVVAPPETAIASGPGTTQSATPTFTFSSAAGNSFECSLDGAAFTPCGSTYATPRLVDGGHSLSVRAKDSHGFVDPTPAQRVFVVDTLPETSILSAVPSPTSNRAVFEFGADQPAGFLCSLDGGRWVPCTSPWTYAGLVDGSHSFEVVAIDPTENVDPTPAVRFWSIDATPPQFRLKANKQQNAVATRGVVVAATCPAEACKLRAVGTIAVGAKTVRLKVARAAAGRRASLKLALTGKKLRLVRAALGEGRKLKAQIDVSAEDALGNVAEQELLVQLLSAKPRERR